MVHAKLYAPQKKRQKGNEYAMMITCVVAAQKRALCRKDEKRVKKTKIANIKKAPTNKHTGKQIDARYRHPSFGSPSPHLCSGIFFTYTQISYNTSLTASRTSKKTY